MGAFIDTLAEQGGQMAGNVVNAGMGLLLGKIQDKRQLKQQKKLQDLQIAGNMQMGDYNYGKQLQMWKDTSYPAQMEQLKAAGLNPGLMYGMGGGGAQSTGNAGSGVQGGTAPTGGGEAAQMMGMGIQSQLLKAQKELIEAQTRKTIAEAEGTGLENAFTAWMQGTNLEGTDAGTIDKSIRGQKNVQDVKGRMTETQFKLDENERQKLMNNAKMTEIGARISLMHKQGLSQDEIYNNLKKEGLLKDAEIEWNKLDLTPGNAGKFITNIIKMLFRPK